MPSYNTHPKRVIYPGAQIALVNDASTDSGVTTSQQCYIGPNPGQNSNTITVLNTTNQDAIGQFASIDATANYKNLSGLIVPAGTALPYNLSDGWLRFTFGTAPTSGSLIVAR